MATKDVLSQFKLKRLSQSIWFNLIHVLLLLIVIVGLRAVHTGTNISARYSPTFFNAFFCVHTKAISADDEPSEHANSFPDIRWRLM